MKKVFSVLAIFVIALCAISFTSCSSDDDDEKVDLNAILGAWSEMTSKSSENVTTEVVTTWTFNADKTASEHVEAYMTTIYTSKTKVIDKTMGFTYEYNGKKVTLKSTSSVDDPISVYDVTIDGNKMRMGNEEAGYFNLTKK